MNWSPSTGLGQEPTMQPNAKYAVEATFREVVFHELPQEVRTRAHALTPMAATASSPSSTYFGNPLGNCTLLIRGKRSSICHLRLLQCRPMLPMDTTVDFPLETKPKKQGWFANKNIVGKPPLVLAY